MKKSPWIVAMSVCAVTALAARGEPAVEIPAQETISRKDYDALKRDHDELKKEFDEFKKDRGKAVATPAAAPANNNDAEFEAIDKTLRDIKLQLKESKPGLDKFLLAGDGSVGFQTQRGTKSNFFAAFSPLVLYQPTDRLLIEVAADINISNDATGAFSTSINLGIANASYIVNDNLVVGGGLFVAPFGIYHRHFDPPWINKLPDDPLVFSSGVAPGSIVGVYASGAIPVKSMKVLYDAYLSNGPNVQTVDPGAAGQLIFNNYSDLNNNKAVGGRIALQPVTALEFGYSFQYGRAGATGFKDLNALVQAVDFQYRKEFKEIMGTIDVNGQWVWSNVSKATYDASGKLGFGPLSFKNERNGGYILVAYRPTGVSNKIVRNLEFIVRYDRLQSSQKAPGGGTEQRWELGVDYWLTPSVVLKTAYEFDVLKGSAGADAFVIQLGFGL